MRVGFWDGQCVVNPTSADLRTKSRLNLLVAGTEDAIVMVESGAQEISEAEMIQALSEGHAVIKPDRAPSRSSCGPRSGKPKREVRKEPSTRASSAEIEAAMARPPARGHAQDQQARDVRAHEAGARRVRGQPLPERPSAEKRAAVPAVYDGLREKLLRNEILGNGRRLDGRRFDEIRPITCEVGVLPRTHGSALFTRGETQALVTVTLGTSEDSQIIDTVQEPRVTASASCSTTTSRPSRWAR